MCPSVALIGPHCGPIGPLSGPIWDTLCPKCDHYVVTLWPHSVATLHYTTCSVATYSVVTVRVLRPLSLRPSWPSLCGRSEDPPDLASLGVCIEWRTRNMFWGTKNILTSEIEWNEEASADWVSFYWTILYCFCSTFFKKLILINK